MKKRTLLVALALGVTGAFAQDLTSKKGEKYLPETGDWSIGYNAEPILNLVGRVMGGSTSGTSLSNPMGYTNYITGKYYRDEKTAYRAAVGINFGSATQNQLVPDVTSTSTPPAMVKDSWKHSTNSITLGAGMEKRRGTTRLQGYYGAMVMFDFGGSDDSYKYGNALSSTNTFHTNTFSQGAGVTDNKAGSTLGVSLNGFIGAEYFIAPKISVGAEYWWGIGFSSTGEGSMKTETWDASSSAATTTTVKTGGAGSFNLGNSVGMLLINLHF